MSQLYVLISSGVDTLQIAYSDVQLILLYSLISLRLSGPQRDAATSTGITATLPQTSTQTYIIYIST